MTELPVQVVLASRSPQRRRLLGQVVARFEVVEPHVDESVADGTPEQLAGTLARLKARDVAARRPGALVVAADTLVECGGEVIGKPVDRADAVRILTLLCSRPHRVLTALCVQAPDGRTCERLSVSELRMRPMSPRSIERYVDEHDVLGRAGAYGLREEDPNVLSLRGSPSGVMGLSVEDLREALCELYPQERREQ